MPAHSFLLLFLTLPCLPVIRGAEEIQVHLQMREETPLYTRIGSVTASLPSNVGKKLRFHTERGFFSIAPDSGDVTVSRLIDRERICPDYKQCCGVVVCQLEARILVTNEDTGELTASVILKVDIQDQNDNRPSFTGTSQTVSFSENAVVGSYVTLASATDADIDPANQIQNYVLLEPTKTFHLDLDELPTVRLQLVKPLDREKTAAYTSTLEACDLGACTRQNVEIKVLDENDNQPKFDTNRITQKLMENTEVGSVVLRLNATDDDSGERGRVLYNLKGSVDPDLADTFELVQSTGEIKIKRQLAANIRTNYRFKVVACDAVTPACAGDDASTVDITFLVEDINNYPPIIHAVPAGITLSPNNLPGRVGSVDQSQRLFDGASDEAVGVFENTPPSQLVVITVRDNDLGENARVACQLNETDIPSNAGLPSGYQQTRDFMLTPSSPSIYSLRTARMFDHEVEPTVSATVVCHDFGVPHQLTSARVIIVRVLDVNEYQPEFARRVYVGKVAENTPAGTEVINPIATDRDRGAVLRYAFAAPLLHELPESWNPNDRLMMHTDTSGRETNHPKSGIITEANHLQLSTPSSPATENMGVNKYFVIDPETGVIRTSQIPLDRETLASAVLVILVTDSKFPPVYTATTTLSVEVLDENDNAPVFTNPPSNLLTQSTSGGAASQQSPTFTVIENAPRFTRVSQKLEAHDPDQGDNGRVHFSLLETYAFPEGLYSAGMHTGRIGFVETSSMSGFMNEIDLSQRVVDQPIFRINPDGYIETLVELDREKVPVYVLKIGVYDRGAQPLASTILLQVEVLDDNDNAPVWIFPTPNDRVINLTTAMKPGSLAGRLRAEDIDTDESGKLDYLLLGPRGELLKGVSIEEGLLASVMPVNEKSGDQMVQDEKPATVVQKAITTSSRSLDRNGYRFGPLYLNGSTGEIWIAQALTPGTIDLHLRAQDRGVPKSQTDAWLTINFFIDPNEDPGFFNFGGDGTLNVTIILAMITITAIVSLLLIIGIVCVRRRPIRYHTNCSPISNQPVNGPGSPGSHLSAGGYLTDQQHKNEMNGLSWSSGHTYPAGGGTYPTGLAGSPMFEDGPLFATFASPGLVGYGPMGVGASGGDTTGLLYVSQPGMGPPMTPQHQQQQQTMHSFGTLARGRGPLSGCTGYSASGYEPHLDADSGDSGRGPSEEGNQMFLSESYRNASTVPLQYNTYAGYRPSSQVGYYRPNAAIETTPPVADGNMQSISCSVPNENSTCACYLSPDGSGVLYPVAHTLDHGEQTLVPIYNGGSITAAHGGLMPCHVLKPMISSSAIAAPTPPPRSPISCDSGRQARRVDPLGRIQLPPLANQATNVDNVGLQYLTSSSVLHEIGHYDGDGDIGQETPLTQEGGDGPHSSVPLRIDLRQLPPDALNGKDDIGSGDSTYTKQKCNRLLTSGANISLPPLASKCNGGTECVK